jgi:hypothetical protein
VQRDILQFLASCPDGAHYSLISAGIGLGPWSASTVRRAVGSLRGRGLVTVTTERIPRELRHRKGRDPACRPVVRLSR